ncbi:hypothetical protein BDF20DRAFT_844252 [Mycotypha africana]|uniref:uncharacterized protein n=1 Tax=Mycotypha africana TaxID=64632 RepID=UPI0022FFF7BB|nr:uncharacterized protein BDF20DRAFT_844252 [Mycotypha africana]KAI8991362.1 hypothetical protein BDF20DRAFT_844252 [Mycotypha africana]
MICYLMFGFSTLSKNLLYPLVPAVIPIMLHRCGVAACIENTSAAYPSRFHGMSGMCCMMLFGMYYSHVNITQLLLRTMVMLCKIIKTETEAFSKGADERQDVLESHSRTKHRRDPRWTLK